MMGGLDNSFQLCSTPFLPTLKSAVSMKMAKMYTVKASPGKGRGVFATRAMTAGTIIMKDRAALKVPKEGPSVREEDVLKGFDRLSEVDQQRFLELHDGKRPYSKIFRIWKANVFGGNGFTALYFQVSLINHACVPNAGFRSKADDHAEIVALKPVAKGEEISITYNAMFDTLSKRHRGHALRLYYDFECSCSVCSLPEDQLVMSDARRQLLNVLKNALDGFQPIDTKKIDFYGTLDGQQAEHSAVLHGVPRVPLTRPLSMEQKNAYDLLVAGLLVAEGHTKLVLADAYSRDAERLLHRMQVLDDVISLQAAKAVETWMHLALQLTKTLCGIDSEGARELQKMWKWMMDTDQMSAVMAVLRNAPAKEMKKTFGVRLGEVVNGGTRLSMLKESEYWAAVRQKRRQGLLS